LNGILARNGKASSNGNGHVEPTPLVTELVKNSSERTVEARAPLPYQHDEWRPAGEQFKSIPETKEKRDLIRLRAADVAQKLPRNRPPTKQVLGELATELLQPLGYDHTYTGFAMVMLNNEYWREEFA